MSQPSLSSRLLRHACLAGVVLVMLFAIGCSARPGVVAPVGAPAAPSQARLASPEAAVRSYLDWTSYAYRIGDSDVATQTMTGAEEVRVNSYVRLNTEKNRRIEQVLVSFAPREPSVEATHATLGASEAWEYRYVSADGMKALSETYTASYETTYTLVRRERPRGWIVESVEVKALGEVK